MSVRQPRWLDKYKSTRAAALKAGDIKYYSGKPCKHGHLSPRHTQNDNCCECQNLRNKKARNAEYQRRIRIPESEWPEVIRLYVEEGYFICDVVDEMHVHHNCVSKLLTKFNIKRHTNCHTHPREKKERSIESNDPNSRSQVLGYRRSESWIAARYAGQRYDQ